MFITILLAILVFGFIIFTHELGHFLTAKWAGVRVNEFAVGMGPRILKWGRGETVYALRLLPIGGFVAMEGEDEESDDERSFSRCPVWKRMIITVAGAVMNILTGLLVVMLLTMSEKMLGTAVIAGFTENSASAEVLRVNDRILSVNGERVVIDNDILYSLIRDRDGLVDFTVQRGGEELPLQVQFQMRELGDGTSSIVLDFSVYGETPTPLGVVRYGFQWTGSLIRLVWNSLKDIVTGNFSFRQLSGPVGVTSAISEATSQGMEPFLFVLALITVNIGIFNLLPLPALDGGRLVFMLIELVCGRPVPQNTEAIIHTVGLALLMVLMIAVTYNDIMRLITGG